MLLPRLTAAAEIGHRGEVDWDDFEARLPALAREWTARGWAWHRSRGVAWD